MILLIRAALWLSRRLVWADLVFVVVCDWLFALWAYMDTPCTLTEAVKYVGFNTSGSFIEDIFDTEMGRLTGDNA